MKKRAGGEVAVGKFTSLSQVVIVISPPNQISTKNAERGPLSNQRSFAIGGNASDVPGFKPHLRAKGLGASIFHFNRPGSLTELQFFVHAGLPRSI